MLPGITSALMGGSPPPTYGVDKFTKSLMKFDGAWGATLAGNALTDYVKKSRVWATTVTGNQSAGQKFAGTAAYLNGASGSYIYAPPSDPDYDINPGQDFTIDFWAYCLAPAGAGLPILVRNTNTNPYAPFLFYQNANNIYFYSSSNGTSWDIASNLFIGPASQVFHHYAVQRKGNVWNTWCDGIKQTEWTSALNPILNNGYVIAGNWIADVNNTPWQGYIDELRFSSCARYSGNFVPQNFPYYGTLSGGNDAATKLLLHFNGNYVDSAAGSAMGVAHPMTVNGSVPLLTGGPLGGDASALFSGATNTLVYTPWPNNADLMPNNGDWTFDFWFYRIASGQSFIAGNRTASSQLSTWILFDDGANLTIYACFDGSTWGWSGIALGALPSAAWTHVAIGTVGNAFRCYINGVKTHERAAPQFLAMGYGFCVGGASDTPGGYGLYLDEIRFSDVARWTANFTPLATLYGPNPDLATKFLLHMDGPNGSTIYDDSSPWRHGQLGSSGNAKLTTAQSKFGGASLALTGGIDYIAYSDLPDLNPGTNNFTVDFWARVASTGVQYALFGKNNAPLTNGYGLYVSSTGTVQAYWLPSDAAFTGVQSPPLVSDTNWHHYVLQRRGAAMEIYFDGTLAASGAITATASIVTAADIFAIGQLGAYRAINLNGNVDEFRLSNVARYAGSFVPPTAPYS
jgi:concanavalin A-like lectin/glucanase superfamily protein